MSKLGAWLRRLLHRDRKIVVPKPPPMPDKGVYITAKQVREIIKAQLGSRMTSHSHIHLADIEYYCPSVQYMITMLGQDLLDTRNYASERFDCDDFAWVLKARFCLDAYKDGRRRAAHAAGIVWGKLPHPHAMCWVITDDLKLRLIEPQNDGLKAWGEEFKIWMMAG